MGGTNHAHSPPLPLCVVLLVGCIRPFDVPEFQEVSNSETAFLVPLTGDTGKQTGFDSQKYLSDRKVAVKRVQIPHEWVQTGRWSNDGKSVQAVRLIKVNRAPVTREWTAGRESGTSQKNEAISMRVRTVLASRLASPARLAFQTMSRP